MQHFMEDPNWGGSRGRVQGLRTPPVRWPVVFQYNWYSAKKKTMWFIGVEIEQETSAPPPKKNPGSAPAKRHNNKFLFLFLNFE